MKNISVLLLLVALVAPVDVRAAALAPDRGATIVLMPFENLTGSVQAERQVWQLLAAAIEAKGWRVADRQQLETLLEEERVRYFDSVDDPVRASIIEGTAGSAIVSGVLYTWNEGRNPVVALSARMVRADGTLGWGDVAALSSDDTERMLGFGRDDTTPLLLGRLVEKMMARFPEPGRETTPVAGRSRPFFLSNAVSYRAPELDPKRPHKVCILPFENLTGHPVAPRIVADVLAVRLAAASGFEVVEPANVRAAAVKARIGTFRDISTEDLARLSSTVGTSLFAKGTIYEYEDPAGRGSASPRLQIEITVVDVEQSRVVWSAQHVRDGSDYSGFLMRGAVTTAVSLADRVVTEMIEAGMQPAPPGEAAVTARNGKRVPARHSSLRRPRKGETNGKD